MGLSLLARFTVQALPDVGPALLLMLISFFGFAFLGVVLGVIGLIRSRQLALVLVLPILYGLVLAGFLAGEFLGSHSGPAVHETRCYWRTRTVLGEWASHDALPWYAGPPDGRSGSWGQRAGLSL